MWAPDDPLFLARTNLTICTRVLADLEETPSHNKNDSLFLLKEVIPTARSFCKLALAKQEERNKEMGRLLTTMGKKADLLESHTHGQRKPTHEEIQQFLETFDTCVLQLQALLRHTDFPTATFCLELSGFLGRAKRYCSSAIPDAEPSGSGRGWSCCGGGSCDCR